MGKLIAICKIEAGKKYWRINGEGWVEDDVFQKSILDHKNPDRALTEMDISA